MIKYIVNVKKETSPPSYLIRNRVYRLSNCLPETDPKSKSFQVRVLHENQWPAYHHLGLTGSQFEAFRAALTKQLVIIQALPGDDSIEPSTAKRVFNVCFGHSFDLFLQELEKSTLGYALWKRC